MLVEGMTEQQTPGTQEPSTINGRAFLAKMDGSYMTITVTSVAARQLILAIEAEARAAEKAASLDRFKADILTGVREHVRACEIERRGKRYDCIHGIDHATGTVVLRLAELHPSVDGDVIASDLHAELIAKGKAEAQAASQQEVERLRAAIHTVLADGESQHPGGWGPDVTMLGVLLAALAPTPTTSENPQ